MCSIKVIPNKKVGEKGRRGVRWKSEVVCIGRVVRRFGSQPTSRATYTYYLASLPYTRALPDTVSR